MCLLCENELWEVRQSRKRNINEEASRYRENGEMKRCRTYLESIEVAHD